MATSPSTIRVTHDYLADEIEAAGKKLIELALRLRDGFDVDLSYDQKGADA